MFKRKRTKGRNREKEETNRGTKTENRGNKEGLKKNISNATDSNGMYYEEGCSELLRELVNLSSKQSALIFELYQVLEEAKVETIRLAGLIAECRYYDPNLAENLYKQLEDLFKKYVQREKS